MKFFKEFRKQEVLVLFYRIFLAYVFYQVARLLFWYFNKELIKVDSVSDYFNLAFHDLMEIQSQRTLFEALTDAMRRAFRHQQKQTSRIIAFLQKKDLVEFDASTLMNVHHEILSVKKSLLRALAHLKLTVTQSEEFEFIPEF